MPELDRQDKQHLDAAEGWLGLGNWRDANKELENITAAMGTACSGAAHEVSQHSDSRSGKLKGGVRRNSPVCPEL